jgi:hypothetical protein
VQACTWLSRDNVQSIRLGQNDDEKIQQFVVEYGEIHPAELNIHRMFHTDLWRDGEIYTGSQLALTKWLECWTEPTSGTISSKMWTILDEAICFNIVLKVILNIVEVLEKFLKIHIQFHIQLEVWSKKFAMLECQCCIVSQSSIPQKSNSLSSSVLLLWCEQLVAWQWLMIVLQIIQVLGSKEQQIVLSVFN